MLLRRISDKEITGWKTFKANIYFSITGKNASPYPLNSSVMPPHTERPNRNTAHASNTSRPIHLRAPCCPETSPAYSHQLLVDLQHEKNLPCCFLPHCCSCRGQVVGMTATALAPMDIQGWRALHARWGITGGYGKWLQTPWSLKRTGSVRKVSTPHASIADPLTTPPPPAPVYIGEWFLSTKPSLHAPQHPCSGTRGHRLLPHSFLPPIPALQCEQSTRHASGTGFGCTGCIPAALPARGCTLSVKSINLSAGWKKTCRWVS